MKTLTLKQINEFEAEIIKQTTIKGGVYDEIKISRFDSADDHCKQEDLILNQSGDLIYLTRNQAVDLANKLLALYKEEE
jgi:hypothetical protein